MSVHCVTSGRLTSFKPWFPHSEMDNGLLGELKLCLAPGWHSVNVNLPSLVPECFFWFYSLSALDKGGTLCIVLLSLARGKVSNSISNSEKPKQNRSQLTSL